MTASADDMFVGTCECGAPIYRRTRSGTAPKRCEECRPRHTFGGPSRARHGVEDGPVRQARDMVSTASPHARLAMCSAVLSIATGLSEHMAASVITTIEVLLEQGESETSVRRRLNPNPARFGTAPAGFEPPVPGGWINEFIAQDVDI